MYAKPELMRTDILERVRNAIAEHIEIDSDSITPDSSFESIGMDSLDTISMVGELEDEFDIKIPNEEVLKIASVRDLVETISQYI